MYIHAVNSEKYSLSLACINNLAALFVQYEKCVVKTVHVNVTLVYN